MHLIMGDMFRTGETIEGDKTGNKNWKDAFKQLLGQSDLQ